MTTVWCMKTTEFSKLNFILTWITFFYSCLFAVEVRHYVMTVGMNRPNGYFIRYFFCFFAIILQIGFTIRLFYWTLFQTFFVNCISSKTFFLLNYRCALSLYNPVVLLNVDCWIGLISASWTSKSCHSRYRSWHYIFAHSPNHIWLKWLPTIKKACHSVSNIWLFWQQFQPLHWSLHS